MAAQPQRLQGGRVVAATPLMPRLATLVLALLARLLSAQSFPDDRNECPTDDDPCMVGTTWMASEFPVRVTDYSVPPRGFTGKPVAEAVAEGDIIYLLPDGYEIDFSGGLLHEPALYSAPENYVGVTGDTFFPTSDVTVVVNDTHFFPSHINIIPGATVTWDIQTYETINVRSTDNGTSLSSGPINRNWSPKFTRTFHEEGVIPYRNAEVPEYVGGFDGQVTISAYNCSLYTSCTTCLLYEPCLWCPGNGTCHERNVSTNLPLDDGPVVMVSEAQEEFA